MAEVRIARTETPNYEVAPFLGPDMFRTNVFGMNPFTLMRRLGDEMDRAIGKAAEPAVWRPVIEVKRDKDKMLVHAELPGLKKEDVKVTVTGDLLEIEGERKLSDPGPETSSQGSSPVSPPLERQRTLRNRA